MKIVLENYETAIRTNVVTVSERFRKELRKQLDLIATQEKNETGKILDLSEKKVDEVLQKIECVDYKDVEKREIYDSINELAQRWIAEGYDEVDDKGTEAVDYVEPLEYCWLGTLKE